MGSVHGEGKGKGVWVLYQGEKYWLSEIEENVFKTFKEKELKLDFYIEKDGQRVSASLDQLELAE